MEANDSAGGFDGLSRWLGLEWQAFDRVRLTIRPEHMNPAGLLAGGVTYAMVDYCMGTTLWRARGKGERVATINIAINYLRTAREGEVYCASTLDRRNDRVAVLSSRVFTEMEDHTERLVATAIGSYSIFPAERLGPYDHGTSTPE